MANRREASLTLGMTLMKKLCTETKENFVFSPLSLGTAFAMLSAGLKGESKKEVMGFLGCADESLLHEMYTELTKNKDLPIKIANKLLVDHKLKIKKSCDDLLKDKYDLVTESKNFAQDAAKTEREVNEWVASKTNDMIKQLLSPGTLLPNSIMVLLNAVYFKGTWITEFEPLPYEMDFKLRDGTKVKKNFMTKKSSDFKYIETEHLKMVKIPYKEAGCYMVVAIPSDENKHIDEVLSKMSASEMAEAIEKLNKIRGPKVVLTMPKFKIDFKYNNVKEHMKALGVNKIFNAGEADFGDMFEQASIVYAVSDVIHQAVIKVDEKGTEAAAATAIVMLRCSMVLEEPLKIDIDQPFYFATHAGNGQPTFQGICFQPPIEITL